MGINEEHTVWAINVVIVVVLVYVVWYTIKYSVSKSWGCSTMNRLYSTTNGKIHAVGATDYLLRDYYVKTAYNCCSSGDYRNDYVDTCALEAVIREGARCLDFEVYSINDQPVVATSASGNICAKETFNHVPVADVLSVIKHAALGSLKNCPNPSDPLIIHVRAKSENVKMFDNFAKILEPYDSVLLGKAYIFENQGKNLGSAPISALAGKITLIVDRSNPAFLESQTFREYVNLTSNSIFMRALPMHDIKYGPDSTELTEYNKKFLTLGMPDMGRDPENPNGVILRETGCQFLGARFQRTDTYLQEILEFFDLHGQAFVLKPERLRYVPVTVAAPAKQNPELSYATRKIQGRFYEFAV